MISYLTSAKPQKVIMAKVQLCNITVMDNPSPFLNPFQFEITFECIEELKEGKVCEPLITGNEI